MPIPESSLKNIPPPENSLLDQILLLEEKGYIDFRLNSNPPQKYLVKELQDEYDKIFMEPTLPFIPDTIHVKTIGQFNEGMDTVPLTFVYNVNTQNGDINVKSLIADVDGIKKEFHFKEDRQLPEAYELYLALSKEFRQDNPHIHFGDKNAINPPVSLIELKNLLEKKEFLGGDSKGYKNKESFDNDPRPLKELLANLYKTSGAKSLNIRKSFNQPPDKVSFTFNVTTNLPEQKLIILGLWATMAGEQVGYTLPKHEKIPAATEVYDKLQEYIKLTRARNIVPKPSKGNQLKP